MLQEKLSESSMLHYELGLTKVISKPLGHQLVSDSLMSESSSSIMVTSSQTIQTEKKPETSVETSVTVESPPMDSVTISQDRSITCENDTLITNSSQTLVQESTLKEKVFKPFWNLLSKEWSAKLLSLIGIDSPGSDMTSSNGFSKSTTQPSWFSMTSTQVVSKSLPMISFPSSTFFPVESTENASTRKRTSRRQKVKTKATEKKSQKEKGEKESESIRVKTQNKKKKANANQTKVKTTTKSEMIRLYPTMRDMKTIRMWFNHARKTYNLALEAINIGKFKPWEFDKLRWRFVPDGQRGKQLAYLGITPSKIRAGAIRDLCDAFDTNFKKKKVNPNHKFKIGFRSRKEEQSIAINYDSFVKAGSKTPKKILFPKSIKDDIKTSPAKPDTFWSQIENDCRLILNKNNEVYLMRVFECPILEDETRDERLSSNSLKVTALDPGVRTAFTGFNNMGDFIEYGKGDISKITRLCYHLDQLIGKHDIEQNYRKRVRMKRAINRARLKIFRLIKDFRHQVTYHLVRNNDVILIPEFNTSQMVKKGARKISKKTVKQMLTWCHYKFRQLLIAKAIEHGKLVVIVKEDYTSKTCCRCGYVDHKLGGAKVYKCKNQDCKLKILRDFNGAINILLKFLTEKRIHAIW